MGDSWPTRYIRYSASVAGTSTSFSYYHKELWHFSALGRVAGATHFAVGFAVSLGCDCSRRHRNSTHRCESHDSASTEQEGVTQGEEVQMIRFSLGMSTESWLELVFWVLFACFYPAGGGGASCDWTKRCERVKTLCVEFKKEPKIIISVSSLLKKKT